jgi:hypothetical protein
MAQVIARTALAALELSRAPFHEPFHTDGWQWPMSVTERSDRKASAASQLDAMVVVGVEEGADGIGQLPDRAEGAPADGLA